MLSIVNDLVNFSVWVELARNHVVNCRHVDGVVGNGNEEREDHGRNPVRLGRSHGCPGKAKEANGLQRSQKEQPLEAKLGCYVVRALAVDAVLVPEDPGDVAGVGNGITNVDWDEGPGNLKSTEAPLLVHGMKALLEGKDESIGESREKRTGQDDGLAEEHLEGAHPCDGELVEGDAGTLDLVGAPGIRVLACLTAALGLLVHDDGGATLGHEEVDGLGGGTEDELDPEVPVPGEELLDGTADHGADGRTGHRGHDHESDGPLLVVRGVEISDHAESDTAASSTETTLNTRQCELDTIDEV